LIVADTNLIAYLLIRGERTELAERAYQKEPHWAAPLLWRSEFRNILAFYMRRSLLSVEQAIELAEKAELLLRQREFELRAADVLELAVASRCSAYDCEFVALARQLGVPLVTCDQAVLSAFPSTALSLDAFVRAGPRISGPEGRRASKGR
jgi:predicted nucleic acid-binding protein